MILAEKIIQLRKKNGWSQEELAEKMNVSRQSVSKWEGSLSVPDLNKILLLSQIFSVSIDYLLKDELEELEYIPEEVPSDVQPSLRHVSMEEANAFLAVKEMTAPKIAFAVFLCILSPICLIILGVAAETNRLPFTENTAGGIGMVALLVLIAIASAIFIFCGTKTAPFMYLEQAPLELEYGVAGMVKERKKQYLSTYNKSNILGTCICILSTVPLFMGCFFTTDDFIIAASLCFTLFLVSIGVVIFIYNGIHWASMQKLLEEGDYSRTTKKQRKSLQPAVTAYWLIWVAVYLGYSLSTNAWDYSWVVWPVAGVLFPVCLIICRLFIKND